MKKIVFVLLMSLTYNLSFALESYINFNPKVKLGKYENGNYFLDAVFAKANYRVNDYLSFSGGASVGFTAPRGGFGRFNHYMNRVNVRSTYRPFRRVGFFAEANFSNIIDGANAPVDYFSTGNYQAIGMEIDFLKVVNLK